MHDWFTEHLETFCTASIANKKLNLTSLVIYFIAEQVNIHYVVGYLIMHLYNYNFHAQAKMDFSINFVTLLVSVFQNPVTNSKLNCV